MIKYFFANRYLVKLNTEKLDKVDTLDYHRNNIDWMWIVDEDGELDGKSVSKGDIVISFYDLPGVKDSRETIIVKDEALKDYYKRFDKAQEEYENNLDSQPICNTYSDCCCKKQA